jgi:hypothetical protein
VIACYHNFFKIAPIIEKENSAKGTFLLAISANL